MQNYSHDQRIVMTLDAGGTNFVFSAMQANRPVVESFALPSSANDLERSLDTLIEGVTRVRDQLPAPPLAISFAFHLLLAYLVDHISIHAAFLISSVVSVFLVVSYLRLVAGFRFAAVEAASAQFVYLVLFSYGIKSEDFTRYLNGFLAIQNTTNTKRSYENLIKSFFTWVNKDLS